MSNQIKGICPVCGEKVSAPVLEENNYFCCLGCGSFVTYDEEYKFRLMELEEIGNLDCDIRSELVYMRKLIQQITNEVNAQKFANYYKQNSSVFDSLYKI